MWSGLWLLPLIVLAPIPWIKENIGFRPPLGTEPMGKTHNSVFMCKCRCAYTHTSVYVHLFLLSVLYVFLYTPQWLRGRIGWPCWGFVATLTCRSQDCGFKWATNHQTGHTDGEECWSRRQCWINKIVTDAVCLYWKNNPWKKKHKKKKKSWSNRDKNNV